MNLRGRGFGLAPTTGGQMPNPRSGSGMVSKGGPGKKEGAKHDSPGPYKTASWPGAPGKKRPMIPGSGFGKKIPQSVKSDC